MFTSCARVCMPQDVHPPAGTSPFRCVHPVHVCGCLWKCTHMSVLALLGVYALCTCVYASRRASTCLYRPFSVCTPCERACTLLNVHLRASTGPCGCVRPLYVSVHLWTCIHVPVPALFGVYSLCKCVYASGRASTRLYRSFSVCTPCARVSTPLDVHPRAYTGPFLCVRHVHVCVRLWTFIHVPVPAPLGVNALFTCVYVS